METLEHARDARSALPAFFTLMLLYVLVAAALLGQVVQNANAAQARSYVTAPADVTCVHV
jgi:hypothetical protein